MKSVVIYASRSGNTRTVAEAVAEVLGQHGAVELYGVDEAPAVVPSADLVVIGGPTEGHGLSEPMKAYLGRLEADSIRGRAVASFDTRVDWPRWLSGSAADHIADALRERGAHLVGEEGSFIVSMKPELEPGELDRVRGWADQLATKIDAIGAGAG